MKHTTAPHHPDSSTGHPRVKTSVRAGQLDPAPYQGKRSTGGYVPT